MRKIIQLQRIAQLLTASAVGIPLPNINGLLALSQIGPSTYNSLRASCPLLGLPPLNTNSVNQLVAAVRSAYQQIQNDLLVHPFASLAGLDDQLNQVLNEAEGALFSLIGPGMSMLGCLQSLCNAGSAISGQAQTALSAFTSTSSGSNYGTVLTPSMQGQVAQYQALGTGISTLMDVPATPTTTPTPLTSITTPYSQDPSYAPNTGNSSSNVVGSSQATPAQIAAAQQQGAAYTASHGG